MVKLREDQARLQGLLKETITLLCKNGLQFSKGFSIEALIGITTDDQDVFLVNIKENVKNPAVESDDDSEVDTSADQRQELDGTDSEAGDTPRTARKRPPDSGRPEASPVKRIRQSANHDDDDDASNFSSINASEHDSAMNIKSEPADDELVFVKQEMSDHDNSAVHSGVPYPITSAFPGHGLNTSLPNFAMNSPNASGDGSQMGALNETWAGNLNQSGSIDPSALANVTSQSTSQGGSGQMKCPFCQQVYKNKTNFTFHMRGAHKFGKPVKCKFCDKGDFTSYWNYNKHLKTCELQTEKKKNKFLFAYDFKNNRFNEIGKIQAVGTGSSMAPPPSECDVTPITVEPLDDDDSIADEEQRIQVRSDPMNMTYIKIEKNDGFSENGDSFNS